MNIIFGHLYFLLIPLQPELEVRESATLEKGRNDDHKAW